MFDLASSVLICDGEFEIVNITEHLYDKAAELFLNHFLKYENISIACDLNGSEETRHEMDLLIRAVLLDGISFGAIHCQTKELVSLAANKILCPKTNCSLSEVCEKFQTSNLLAVSNYLERMECSFDIFKEWNIDCVMEIVFLSTNENFNGRGLATKLSKHSIEFARQMFLGTLKNKETLPAHIRDLKPKAICSVLSSIYSQKVGERLGLKTIVKISHKDFIFDGKTFYEKLDPKHTHSTFGAMKLF